MDYFVETVKICHLERVRRSLRTEDESKDPEDVSLTIQIQGVLARTLALTSCTIEPYVMIPGVRDGFHYKFWVYMLGSRTGTLYVGITGSFDRRIMQHKMDTIEGFTKKYKVHRLVYYETFDDALKAISREKQLKGSPARQEDCTP